MYLTITVISLCLQIKKHKLSYFKGLWNILDILVILISLICVAFDVYRTVAVGGKLASLLENDQVYADFERLSYWETRFSNAIAIAVFLAWIKVCVAALKYNSTSTIACVSTAGL